MDKIKHPIVIEMIKGTGGRNEEERTCGFMIHYLWFMIGFGVTLGCMGLLIIRQFHQ